MIIQSTNRAIPVQSKAQVEQGGAQQPKSEANYFESFQAQAKAEVPRAVAYSAIAGASLGVAAVAFGFSPAMANAAQTVALTAAAGAGIGLFSGLASSALIATARPVPPPVPPAPSPKQLFLQDMNQAEQVLDRRVSGLKNLVKAEQARLDTVGRSGLKDYDAAKELLNIAEQDLAKLKEQRADVAPLDKESSDARLGKLRTQQHEALNMKLQADEIVNKSIGRSGRLSQEESKKVIQELQQEVERVQQASA